MSPSINLYKQLSKNKLFKKTINFNLNRIKLVLNKLGNPEKKLNNVINILGSSGKYSLLTSLKYFIEENNQTTSAYISPSLKDIKERFWIGKRNLSHNEIKKSIKIIEKQNISLTVFEVLTVIFILNAAKKKNDYNLIEAGALFAKDSTNVFSSPLIQAVVNINKQHLNFLKKKTLDEVIYQKVGFLNQNTRIYIGKQIPPTLKKIKLYLSKNQSKKIFSNSWKLIKINKTYFYKDKKVKICLNNKNIKSRALFENLCMAIKIALDLKIRKKIIIRAIPKIFFEGRVQYLKKGKLIKNLNKNEKIIIDGSHAEVDASNLANYLKTIKKSKYGIWGMIKNKEPDLFIKKFKGVFKKIITIPIQDQQNSLSSKLLLKIAKKNNFNAYQAKSIEQAIKKVMSKEKKIIVIFGSLYLIGHALNKN
ncbi:hypothetical protein OAS47_01960 [Pelagibacteraceae bacterium]|nr:hypothetical protein [Pelagibacteraceae bacterium]